MVGLDIDPSTLAIGRDMAARLALMVEPARAEAPAGVGDPPHPTWELGPSRRCGGRAGAETSPGGIASRTATSRSNLGSRLRSRARKRHTNSSTRSSRSSSSRPSACRLRRRTSESCAAMPFGSSVRIASSSPAPSHNRKAEKPLLSRAFLQSGRPDLNRGPHRPERCALPGCATPRCVQYSTGARTPARRHDFGHTLPAGSADPAEDGTGQPGSARAAIDLAEWPNVH